MSNFSRKEFLRTGVLGGLLAGTSVAACTPSAPRAQNWKGKAKNIIFMVSDGMSTGTMTMADQLSRRQFGRATNWISIYEQKLAARCAMDMASFDSIVTDSSAASSSWGCGIRVPNNAVNMGPNGEEYMPILPVFRNAGKKTGLVSTATITHATPAGFIANMLSRNDEAKIATQLLERGADLFLGGGNRFFAGDLREDGVDLYAGFTQAGYSVVRTKDELMRIPVNGTPLLGIFDDSHLPYAIDLQNMPEVAAKVPTLAEMTQVAIDRLRSPQGFILQVEGAKIDHAAHWNDATGMLYDQLDFDNAVGIALKFAQENPDTLLIVTTDHGNANPGLNGEGRGYQASNTMFDSIPEVKRSNTWLLNEFRSQKSSVAQIRELIQTYTLHGISVEQATMLHQALNRTYAAPASRMTQDWSVFGSIMSNYYGVSFSSGSHTSDYVDLAVIGPGSESVGTFCKNTDMFSLMLDAAGITYNG
jgi:alkaline phosphatase